MRLGAEDVRVSFGQEAITLRPTLRAALSLSAKYDGLERLVEALADNQLGAIADVIEASATSPTSLAGLLRDHGPYPAARLISIFAPAATAIVIAIANPLGEEPDEAPRSKKKAPEKITFDAFLEQIFGFATGWMGWTPATAYAATPREIVTAFRAHCDALRAVHGGEDTGASNKPVELDQPSAIFDSFGRTKWVSSKRQAES